ncbi:hypothetical protein [Nonomuraea basaltis]|uniref:hypothetical protein n=1 Tax=Nonomuraea basaltis TaxID=2495887 RepID=UPI001F0FA2DD|nr:hypothetical protein [Nonomuraea basaltis]
MSTDRRETPLKDLSPLDVAEHVFQLVACAPGGLALNGTELSRELPRRLILLTELRDLLTSRALCNATHDIVWRELVIRARRDGPQWLVGAVGTAVPALRRTGGRLSLYHHATQDRAAIDIEVLAAFIAAVKDIDLDPPSVLPRMCAAARRAGERARRNIEAEAARRISGHASAKPAASSGHPDPVVADAIAAGVVNQLDAEPILPTGLQGRAAPEAAAAALRLSCDAAKKERQRFEAILADAVLASDADPALQLAITSAIRRRAESTPKTSARSRITSDPKPINTEQKGGWGNPTGFARNPSPLRRRRLYRGVLVAAVVVIVLAATAAAALADAPTLLRAAAPPKDLNTVFDNLRNWLVGLLAALATLMLTVGGLRYLVAGGDPGEVQKAKAALKAAAYGYGLAVLAPLFVSVLKRIVGGG